MNNDIKYVKTIIKANKSKYGKAIDVGIKNHIFIGYEHTDNIKDYIAKEYWGILNKRLFYHINYTFRARLLNNEIYKFEFNNGITIGLFHTGLQHKNNNKLLYLIFRPNPEIRKQLWTLPLDAKNVSKYMMTKEEIISEFGINENDLPAIPDYFEEEYIFNKDYKLILDWDSALRLLLNHKTGGNSKQVILKEFNKNGIELNSNIMRQQLIKPLTNAVNEALNNYNINNNNNYYVRPGIFFLNDGYKIVHQMLLNVKYNQNSNIITKFVAVFEENRFRKQYTFTKLLNLEMAYKNARLVGKVPKEWTFIEDNNSLNNNNKKKKDYYNNNNNNYNNKKYKINVTPIKINNNNTINNLNYLSDVSSLYSTSNLSTYQDSKQKQNLIPTIQLNDAYGSPFSLDTQQSFPSMIESKSNSSMNNNNNNNNINNNDIYPKTFKKLRTRTLTLINNNNVIESYNESLIETSNLYSLPIKNAKVIGYYLNELDYITQSQLLMSQTKQLKINSEHHIYQISNQNNIESIEETKYVNGQQITSRKTFLNSLNQNGQITTTEFPAINCNNNNINNINNNINNINNINNNNFNIKINK